MCTQPWLFEMKTTRLGLEVLGELVNVRFARVWTQPGPEPGGGSRATAVEDWVE